LCHFVNKTKPLGKSQDLEAEALYWLRLTGADPNELGDYSSRRVIGTTAARRTPKASKPVLITHGPVSNASMRRRSSNLGGEPSAPLVARLVGISELFAQQVGLVAQHRRKDPV